MALAGQALADDDDDDDERTNGNQRSVVSTTVKIAEGDTPPFSVFAECPLGTAVTGGGHEWDFLGGGPDDIEIADFGALPCSLRIFRAGIDPSKIRRNSCIFNDLRESNTYAERNSLQKTLSPLDRGVAN